MPATLTIHPERRLVYTAFHGDLAADEFLHHADAIRTHPNFDPSYNEVVDLRGVTELHANTDTVLKLARRESLFNRESKHVVIASPGLVFRLAKLFQGIAEETRPNLKVVRTPEEAFDYLIGN
jgi:phenylalanine-4-hydroxylase